MTAVRDKKRMAAHVLAVCNAVGFAILFGFAAAMNGILRVLLDPLDALPGGRIGRMLAVPFGAWVAALAASIGLLALVQVFLRGGKAGIIVQTAIGVVQLGVLMAYGAWALWLLFRTMAAV